jgi:predicted Zn finger-like uncharacterized protein
MILTCPKCATRFFAEEQAIGLSGRRVKCGACGEVWISAAARAAEPTASNDCAATDLPRSADLARDQLAGPEPAASVAAPLFVERVSPPRKIAARSPGRRWGVGLMLVALAIVACLIVFQPQIEAAAPGSSTLYQALGLRSSGPTGG